jgi:hypothetical protein
MRRARFDDRAEAFRQRATRDGFASVGALAGIHEGLDRDVAVTERRRPGQQ